MASRHECLQHSDRGFNVRTVVMLFSKIDHVGCRQFIKPGLEADRLPGRRREDLTNRKRRCGRVDGELVVRCAATTRRKGQKGERRGENP